MTDNPLSGPPEKFGLAEFSHKENSAADVKWDRIAHDGPTLMLISLVAEPMRIKAIRAILHAKNGSPKIDARGLGSIYPSEGKASLHGYAPGHLRPDPDGYETHMHKLEYGVTHVVFVARNENFLRHLSPESLWNRLKSDRFSTPILREWMPYVTGELMRNRRLRECRCHRANCGVLSLSGDEHLDKIVSDGLKAGKIEIP